MDKDSENVNPGTDESSNTASRAAAQVGQTQAADVDNSASADSAEIKSLPKKAAVSEESILPDELFNVGNLPSNAKTGTADSNGASSSDKLKNTRTEHLKKKRYIRTPDENQKIRRQLSSHKKRWDVAAWKAALAVLSVMVGMVALAAILNLTDSVLPFGLKALGFSETPSYTLKNGAFDHYTENVEVVYSIDGGASVSCSTRPVTIREFIESVTGESSDKYKSNYDYDKPLENGMNIEIKQITTEKEVVTETLNYETVVYESQTIPKGTRVKVQSGINGLVTREYKYTYLNGEIDGTEILSEKVIRPSQAEIIYEGVGGTFKAPNGVSYEYSYYIDVEATAYGVDTGFGGDSNYVASGKPVSLGMIAVDPNMIPLGSKCYVTGEYKDIGICYAEDTGGAIIGNRIDVYLGDDLNEQMAFGRRRMRVYILG